MPPDPTADERPKDSRYESGFSAVDSGVLVTAVADLAELVAARVVEVLDQRERRGAGLATATEVAERLGVGKSWVYANQQRLGAIRLGHGPKARLRFDLEQATRAINDSREDGPRASRRRGRPRKTSALPAGVELLGGRHARGRD